MEKRYEVTAYGLNKNEIINICQAAKEKNLNSLCVPQWFVSIAANAFSAAKIKAATRIGLCDGSANTQAKYAEAKIAARNGAQELYVSLSAAALAENNLDALQNDLEYVKMAVTQNIALYAVMEYGLVKKDRVAEITGAVKACGVNGIAVAGRFAKKKIPNEFLLAVKAAAGDLPVIQLDSIL